MTKEATNKLLSVMACIGMTTLIGIIAIIIVGTLKERAENPIDVHDMDGTSVTGAYIYGMCDDILYSADGTTSVVINNGVATNTYTSSDALKQATDKKDIEHYINKKDIYMCRVEDTGDGTGTVYFDIQKE